MRTHTDLEQLRSLKRTAALASKGGPVPYAENPVSVQVRHPACFDGAMSLPSARLYDLPGKGLAPRRGLAATLQDRDARSVFDVMTNGRRKPEQWENLQARMALDPSTRADAYRLRHLCYASKGFIDLRDTGLFSDEYDCEPDNTTMVVYNGGQAVGSVRVCTMAGSSRPDEVRDLPVAHVFPSEVRSLLAPGTRAVEINRLVSHPDHAQSLGLVFVLMRLAGYVIGKYNPDFVTSCVRANHVPFYKRLQFEDVAGPRLYTGLKFMTNFMVARQERYDTVRQTVPVLNLSEPIIASYDRLWNGNGVAVFGDQ